MADVNTGSNGVLRINAWLSGGSDAGNYSDVSWELWLIERTAQTYGWQANPKAASVDRVGVANLWSGSYTYDFRPSGAQSVFIASGTTRVYHNPDGSSPGCTIRGNIADSGTSTVGGPASVDQGVSLPTRKVLPGTPTGVTATRISDTQISLSWSQTSASNGQPTTNTIQKRTNGGAWTDVVTISAATSATVAAAANEKTEYRVRGNNAAGSSNYSAASAAVYTTPAAPTAVSAAKDASLDIVVGFTSNVAYSEHQHEIWHGVSVAGVITWDGAALVTLASGVSTYTHDSPDPSDVHVYRVRAVAGTLASSYAQSNTVQLLVAPNAPTVPALPAFADKSVDLDYTWVHNPIDTTPQAFYQVQVSTDGGATWPADSGKTAGSTSEYTLVGDTFAANTQVSFRVRTWGQATSGGSDGTGASPWSEIRTVTLKTRPVATITSPADASTLNDATLRVDISFAQAEGASFVKGELQLVHSSVVVESLETVTLLGTTFATPVLNGEDYTIRARVQGSNGLWSDWVENDFDVEYLLPVAAVVSTDYLVESGFGQISITTAEPGAGEDEASTITVTRTINGSTEVVVSDYPASAEIVLLDTTPTVHGENIYQVTTKSELGAQVTATVSMVTTELRRAFLSKGAGFNSVVVFGGNLKVTESAEVASGTVAAAGRLKPIGLYGVETSVKLKVSSFIHEGFGSHVDAVRALLLVPGVACYRDPSGRRVFGVVKGSINQTRGGRGDLSFTLEETDSLISAGTFIAVDGPLTVVDGYVINTVDS